MSLFTRCRTFVLCALPVILAACADTPVAPSANSRTGASALSAKSGRSDDKRIPLRDNSEKYDDHGAHPATGRSGTAAIMSRALERKDGSTVVEVTTGNFDVVDPSTGYLTKVQAKVWSAGSKQSTKNYNGLHDATFSFPIPGVTRGAIIAIQANVRGRDNNRTDVVNVTDSVWLGADLAVDRVEAPSQVHPGDLMTIAATVSERNGDIGGRADCVLYVDGVRTDVIHSVWVDAGDRATCAFATRVSATGVHRAEVRLEALRPFDYDPSNNSASTTFTVTPTPMQYIATAFEHSGTYHNNYRYTYADFAAGGYSTEYNRFYTEQIRTQSTHLYAWVDAPVVFPVSSLTLSTATDNVTLDRRSYANFAAAAPFGDANDGGACGQANDGGATVVVCTYHRAAALWTTVAYDRYAGVVTYISSQYATYLAPWGSGYYFNVGPTVITAAWGGGAMMPFGATISFSVALTSGSSSFAAAPMFGVTPNAYFPQETWCVGPFANDQNTGLIRECFDVGGTYLDKEGFVFSPGQ